MKLVGRSYLHFYQVRLCDHVLNSRDHSVLQSIDSTRRNLILITHKSENVIKRVDKLVL